MTTLRQNSWLKYLLIIAILIAAIALTAIFTKNRNHNIDITDSETKSTLSTDTDKNPHSDITADEAERIALDEFGGTVKETESDHYRGEPAWEVEIYDSREGRIEVKVHKQSGEILHWEKD